MELSKLNKQIIEMLSKAAGAAQQSGKIPAVNSAGSSAGKASECGAWRLCLQLSL